MDEVIFEEFKGTGNSELILDRKLADRRTFPSIDIGKSGTRKEELLVDRATLSKMWVLRRILMPMGTTDAMDFLMDKLKHTKTNSDFRSEEHTSELQSLMRISYAVFCLKKKKKKINNTQHTMLTHLNEL